MKLTKVLSDTPVSILDMVGEHEMTMLITIDEHTAIGFNFDDCTIFIKEDGVVYWTDDFETVQRETPAIWAMYKLNADIARKHKKFRKKV